MANNNKLYFYHSVMNSGKSAHIIMQVYNLREQGNRVLVLKPRLDTRDTGVVKSRALNTRLESILIDDSFSIFEYIKNERPDFVFVDEVNFLSDNNVEELSRVVDELGISVFAYGLLLDYLGFQFEGSKRMVEMADSIRELKSPCVKCGKKATHHLRKSNKKYVFEGNPIHIGDTDIYESVCRSCYNTEKINSSNAKYNDIN